MVNLSPIKARVRYHNWRSENTRDLLERLDIIKQLMAIPMNDLVDVIGSIPSQDDRCRAIMLIQEFTKIPK